MKIVDSRKAELPVTKIGTETGELYIVADGESVLLRCQGGFVVMSSGKFSPYAECREDACFVHLPNAELHLNN